MIRAAIAADSDKRFTELRGRVIGGFAAEAAVLCRRGTRAAPPAPPLRAAEKTRRFVPVTSTFYARRGRRYHLLMPSRDGSLDRRCRRISNPADAGA